MWSRRSNSRERAEFRKWMEKLIGAKLDVEEVVDDLDDQAKYRDWWRKHG